MFWEEAGSFIFQEMEFFLRLVVASICGALIGLEREKRLKNAGIRTHIIVAISSALMMIVSKYGFFDVLEFDSISVDASRIAAGVVTAIGFLGAGVIYVRKENTIGLTTAAGLWATVGIGIALGAGMYVLGIASTLLILLIQFILHSHFFKLSIQISASVKIVIGQNGMDFDGVRNFFRSNNISIKNAQLSKDEDGRAVFSAYVTFPKKYELRDVFTLLDDAGFVESIEVSTVQ